MLMGPVDSFFFSCDERRSPFGLDGFSWLLNKKEEDNKKNGPIFYPFLFLFERFAVRRSPTHTCAVAASPGNDGEQGRLWQEEEILCLLG